MNLGLLDLPAPLLSWLDAGLAWVGLPALLRVLLYALASAWLCMWLYRRFSRQSELTELASASRELRRELANYDGPFDGLMQRVRKLLGLSSRHLRLSFLPAMLGGLPLLLVLPWMSNQFGLELPEPGDTVAITPTGLEQPVESFTWSDPSARWDEATESWQVSWPTATQRLELQHDQLSLLSLPTVAPAGIVHRHVPVFNWLIGNPAGYLPDNAPLSALYLKLPEQQLHGLGPGWLRGWLAVYLIAMLVFSLGFKWHWKLQ